MQGSGPAIARCATYRAYGQRLAPPSLGSRPVGEVLGIAPSPLPLFPHPRPESAAEPRCQTFPPRRRLAFPEVAEPAAPVGGGFSHPLGQAEASGSARPFPNPLLAAGAGLGGDPPPPDLPRAALDGYGFALVCPLAPPRGAPIRLWFIGSRLCSTLLSGPASRRVLFHPCASLTLPLHPVG
jgi:hypothetical protein